jgi:quercetin dioxygenase-like cupin family protein
MPLVSNSAVQVVEMLPGVYRRTMTDGERMMLCEVRMDAGAVVPMHTHPHEQTGYLAAGRIRMVVAGEERELRPGDSWMVPGGVEHLAEALEPSVLVDVFSPPREEYRVPGP